MKFYQIPENTLADIEELERAIEAFQQHAIHPARFTAIRVAFGIYEQHIAKTFMLRVRCTGGGITPKQLIRVAELAKKFGRSRLHLTTRQEIQIHDVKLEAVVLILKELHKIGLTGRGGGGNTIRNVMASYDSGINPAEIFDVTPYAVAMSSRLLSEPDSWNFPRKIKISFSSIASDNALAILSDLGFIAKYAQGQKGFQVWVAGGMGSRSRTARLLHDFIPAKEIYAVYTAIKRLFINYGNRKNKNANRLRFLWDELGKDRFLEIYYNERAKIKQESGFVLEIKPIENSAVKIDLPPKEMTDSHFPTWKTRFVSNQKQPGLKSIMLPILLGDLSADDAIKLGETLVFFGENVLRLTMRQNIQLRNIPETFLGNIFATIQEMETLAHLPKLVGNTVACAGAHTCTTGICLPGNVVPTIHQQLLASKTVKALPSDLTLNFSGCPNACGQHYVGDLGFIGRISRKNGQVYPAYWVIAGTKLVPGKARLAEKIDWVPAKDMPAVIIEILEDFARNRGKSLNFIDYVDREGRENISAICTKYRHAVPDRDTDESYYYDWGDTTLFSATHMGHGECSAGIYDMIEVEMETIATNRKLAEQSQIPKKKALALWNIVFSAAAMLLVTKGIDSTSEKEIFEAYLTHFIDTGIVSEKFREIVLLAKRKELNFLEQKKEAVFALGDTMVQLYHKMDNALNLPGKRENAAQTKAISPAQKQKKKTADESRIKDLRGVKCPMNFVKTKVELAYLSSGDNLKIYLDNGEPIDNVPRSVTNEGHKVVSQEKIDDYWAIVIEKV